QTHAQVTSKILPVMATVCDEQGRKLTASVVKLPVRLLGRGVLPAIDCAVAATQAQAQGSLSEPAREVALHPLIETTLGLMSLLNVVQENDELAEYFWQVVEKPSIWSVITGFGVKTTFSMGFERSVPAANLPPDLPGSDRAFVVPMQIDVNGSPALFLELTATDAARPYSLCGGIVAGIARHPTKTDHALELQLIAARLGTAKPAKLHVKPGPEPGSGAPSFAGSNGGDWRPVAGVALCWCPAGRFLMGSPPDEPERRPGEDQVEVSLGGFWISKFETTQGQWLRVVGALPGPLTEELPAGEHYPVGNVNFAEAAEFCRKLTELGHRSGDLPRDWEFRLPTEAQWEYACRAGTTTATHFGDQLSSKQANFKGKPYAGAEPGPSLNRAQNVGSYPANAWGLHDMHGNSYEWCRDWYHARLPGGIDPDLCGAKDTATRSEHGDLSRVRRGGCWSDDGWALRSAFRLRFEPERRYDHIGFRVVAVRL
ncbi:MAG TPA: formylglycine-generating enzyme family protein, partial [Planctomycetota bacterium]|nr:formylglycine-generating enzyme family protein [Planctomycetota bacterium]